jgi:cytochrome d ubiquinol oxidase subunit II
LGGDIYFWELFAAAPNSLTVSDAMAGVYGLQVGLAWWVVGMILAGGYFTDLYRAFAGRVSMDGDAHGSRN